MSGAPAPCLYGESPDQGVGTNVAFFRFYAQLNDFLPEAQRHHLLRYSFHGTPSVKDSAEALGIPHPEIDLILANSRPVDFTHQLAPGDHLSVYPHFHCLTGPGLPRLSSDPPPPLRFIADVHLGKLAAKLRLLGFDTLYRNDYSDPEIVAVALAEQRIILTRDRGILKIGKVRHGYWLRSEQVLAQVIEVLARYELFSQIRAFHRCISCNGPINPVPKAVVAPSLAPNTRLYYDQFHQCRSCGKVYWQGSHYLDMVNYIKRILSR